MQKVFVTSFFIFAFVLHASFVQTATPESPMATTCSISLPSSPEAKPLGHKKKRTPSMDTIGTQDSQSIIDGEDITAGETDEILSTICMDHTSPYEEPIPDSLGDNLMKAILSADLNTVSCLIESTQQQDECSDISDQINMLYNVPVEDGSMRKLTPLQLVSTMLTEATREETPLFTAMLRMLLAAGAHPHAGIKKSIKPHIALLLSCVDADKINEAIQAHDHAWLTDCAQHSQFTSIINNCYCSLYHHAQRQTALQTAVKTGCCKCVSILLAAGADPIAVPVADDEHCNRNMPLNIAKTLVKKDPEHFTAIYNLVRNPYHGAAAAAEKGTKF